MDTTSRRAWSTARTLTDLGELTARWLTGQLASRPGYQAGCGPDEETTELLAPLAAANRAGYLTTDSQPGCVEEAARATWRQRAAVQGYIGDPDLLRRIKQAAAREGLLLLDGTRRPPWEIVTTVDGKPFTAFGEPLPGRHIRRQWAGVNRDALKALTGARQVALVHPSWGPAGTRPLARVLQAVAR